MGFINPSMVELARKSRGYTQTKLANATQVTQGTISKIEQGIIEADEDVLNKLSEELNYPIDFFYQSGRLMAPSIKYRRARASLSAKLRDKLDAHHNVIANVLRELLEAVELPANKVPDWPVEDWESPTEIAQALRQYWQVPKGPINNLTKLVESMGIVVVMSDFKTRKFDGVYYPFPDLPPIIFLNKEMPGDRLRFTLAHELGHIIMHQKPKNIDQIEDDTDEFASEFCMPKADIKPHLKNLTLSKLANLKQVWKMSMAALLVRANRVKAISDRKYRYLWTQMGKKGYKKQEPLELNVPKEEPKIVDKLINLHIDKLDYDHESLSKAVHLNKNEFMSIFENRPKLKLLNFE